MHEQYGGDVIIPSVINNQSVDWKMEILYKTTCLRNGASERETDNNFGPGDHVFSL